MIINSRRKGKAGELELIHLLKDQLGEGLRRNLDQPREGGADVLGLLGWAIEIKRAKAPALKEWWSQTIAQAQEAHEKPVLAYRLDRKSWRFLVALRDLVPGFEGQPVALEWTAEVGLDGFCAVVRERLS